MAIKESPSEASDQGQTLTQSSLLVEEKYISPRKKTKISRNLMSSKSKDSTSPFGIEQKFSSLEGSGQDLQRNGKGKFYPDSADF